MIRAELRLTCDSCGKVFNWFPVGEEGAFRACAGELRASARLRGWRRYRPRGARETRDYCAPCLAIAISEESPSP